MKTAIEQSIKEKIKVLAKERETTFAELWRNLILERFLTRLARSPFREKFVLKGGTLLAKYIPIGRETQDLDFFVQNLSNAEHSLRAALQAICSFDTNDSFEFKVTKIKILDHFQLAYRGAEITLLVLFGATQTVIRIDLGFGDRVEMVECPILLTATSKGPLFESHVILPCYPKEYIFAEKLETVVFRGAANTRMKDYHDLFSLIRLDVLDKDLAKKAIELVFDHRKTSLKKLPLDLNRSSVGILERNWNSYWKKLKSSEKITKPPESIEDVVVTLNEWLIELPLG